MATRKDAAIGGQGPWLPIIDGALASLLRDNLAGAADVGWKVLELREPIPHRQHCFGIVDVHLRLEYQVWDRRGKNVDHLQRRMGCHEMTAAQPTELAMAEVCFVVGPNALRALEDLHRLCRPEREGIDRAAGPRTARATMAVAHGIRLAGHPKLDCAAEARAPIRTGHGVPPVCYAKSTGPMVMPIELSSTR